MLNDDQLRQIEQVREARLQLADAAKNVIETKGYKLFLQSVINEAQLPPVPVVKTQDDLLAYAVQCITARAKLDAANWFNTQIELAKITEQEYQRISAELQVNDEVIELKEDY